MKTLLHKLRNYLCTRLTGIPFDTAVALNYRVSRLETRQQLMAGNPYALWLEANASERMDPTYSGQLFQTRRAEFHLMRYRFAAAYMEGRSFLDCACGSGYGCELMMHEGKAARGCGVDIDRTTIGYAQTFHNTPNLDYIVASADAIPLPGGSSEIITSFETIEHVPSDDALLREFQRLLKTGGQLIISTPNAWPLERMPHHLRMYTYESYRQKLAKYFTVEKIWNQNSGSDWEYNHGQQAGIVETTEKNKHLAECFIALCRKD